MEKHKFVRVVSSKRDIDAAEKKIRAAMRKCRCTPSPASYRSRDDGKTEVVVEYTCPDGDVSEKLSLFVL
ncbi:hypothetical protein HPT29_028410 (plasmid) [Microvirga terrae]|uniref:Uncharacterized protein n=1 Tax=Microvirga terrae TaxID=2740529 RepID=A0ABY5S1C9_9HYPH|nr:hypothetical protein [Microvirga terrae]UVF22877.1 hypothetical protein HPT29_028410 [Microvirga terrae]